MTAPVIVMQNTFLVCQDVMCTAVGATGLTIFLDGQVYTRVRIPHFLVWTWAGKRQVGFADSFPFLCISIFQAVILGVSAMSHEPSPQVKEGILTQYVFT